jgi:hypothetical protein
VWRDFSEIILMGFWGICGVIWWEWEGLRGGRDKGVKMIEMGISDLWEFENEEQVHEIELKDGD